MMKYKLDGINYDVNIIKKDNKNSYIRVKEDKTILVTTNYFVSKKYVVDLLERNQSYLRAMMAKRELEIEKQKSFYYLGKKYDIIIVPSYDHVVIHNDKIYTKSDNQLRKWYKEEALRIFSERLDYLYHKIEETIPYPKLKLRTMKTRWGVCNKRDNSITINTNLLKETIDKIDYVIVHELVHFIHFNHSKSFWLCVEKYIPNYKRIRKSLKE
ncbi:MAG: SprT family zinc-dependent metalloprotease [Bacilli bacterium]|nr:SprT family zinc-dependent metalloprotease [Bacilli bacterium]MDD4809366.1 SprT family zinc-dependent metalloprotease [Bacilli bacterium]